MIYVTYYRHERIIFLAPLKMRMENMLKDMGAMRSISQRLCEKGSSWLFFDGMLQIRKQKAREEKP